MEIDELLDTLVDYQKAKASLDECKELSSSYYYCQTEQINLDRAKSKTKTALDKYVDGRVAKALHDIRVAVEGNI